MSIPVELRLTDRERSGFEGACLAAGVDPADEVGLLALDLAAGRAVPGPFWHRPATAGAAPVPYGIDLGPEARAALRRSCLELGVNPTHALTACARAVSEGLEPPLRACA